MFEAWLLALSSCVVFEGGILYMVMDLVLVDPFFFREKFYRGF